SVDMTIKLPAGSNPNRVYKYENGTYTDVTPIATISGNEITLHITDGGLGDEDHEVNGMIVDPIVPARFVRSAPPPVIRSVSPNKGPATGGTSVTITGANLAAAESVKFGANSAVIKGDSATSITVQAPA